MRIAIAVALAVASFAQETKTYDEIIRDMKAKRVTVEFVDELLDDFVSWLSSQIGCNVVVDPDVRKEKGEQLKLNLKLKDASLMSIVGIFNQQFGLSLLYKSDILLFTTKKKAQGNVITKMYDIRDITFKITDFPGGTFELTGSAEGTVPVVPLPSPENPISNPETIMDLIKSCTGGKSWEENENVKISFVPSGLLMVTQTRDVHSEIEVFIQKLRQFK
jgi:hypothetical protein